MRRPTLNFVLHVLRSSISASQFVKFDDRFEVRAVAPPGFCPAREPAEAFLIPRDNPGAAAAAAACHAVDLTLRFASSATSGVGPAAAHQAAAAVATAACCCTTLTCSWPILPDASTVRYSKQGRCVTAVLRKASAHDCWPADYCAVSCPFPRLPPADSLPELHRAPDSDKLLSLHIAAMLGFEGGGMRPPTGGGGGRGSGGGAAATTQSQQQSLKSLREIVVTLFTRSDRRRRHTGGGCEAQF